MFRIHHRRCYLIHFSPNDPDHILLAQNMWNTLKDSGDLEKVFMKHEILTSHQLVNILSPPNFGFLDIDDKGVTMSVWLSSWMNAAWMGLWIREDKRQSRKCFTNLIEVMRETFKLLPVIMGVTQRPEILEIHRKLGYDISIIVPDLYGSKPGWIVQLHRDKFRFLKEEVKEMKVETVEVA